MISHPGNLLDIDFLTALKNLNHIDIGPLSSLGSIIVRRDSMISAFRVRPAVSGRELCDIDRV